MLAEPEGYDRKLLPENPCSQYMQVLILSDGEQIPPGLVSKIHCVQSKIFNSFCFYDMTT